MRGLDPDLNVFIELQKFTNKVIVKQLEGISKQLEGKLILDFEEIKKDIQETLEEIRKVTSREMGSYDAISGMMVALDKKLETINEYVHRNIQRSISYAASIKSTKYGDGITVVQEWYTDFLIMLFEKTTHHTGEEMEKYFKNYFARLRERLGKDNFPQHLEFNDRVELVYEMWADVGTELELDDYSKSLMMTSYVLYVTLINGVSPLTFPIDQWKEVVKLLHSNTKL